MDNNAVNSLFVFFITTSIIIIAAYYATRFIGRKTAGLSQRKHVSLIEKNILHGNLSIEVVKVADQVYVLACRGKDVTLLDRYSMDEWLEKKLIEKDTVYVAPKQDGSNLYRRGIDLLKKRFITDGYEKND